MTKIFLTYFIIVLSVLSSQAQTSWSWNVLESHIRSHDLLAETDILLAGIIDSSKLEKDYVSMARAMYDRMLIRDRRAEDSCYFQNSAFLDSMLAIPGTPQLLKPLLHLMQADRLAGFARRTLKFNRARYETPGLLYNYAALTPREFDSVVLAHFEMAKDFPLLLDTLAAGRLIWLSNDPLFFLFKPHWLDIVEENQLTYISPRSSGTALFPGAAQTWLRLSPAVFIDSLGTIGNGLAKLYTEWLAQRRSDRHAYYFIEMIARKALAETYSDSSATRAYEDYLFSRTLDTIQEVKAYAIYQLCLAWYQDAQEGEYRYYDGFREAGYFYSRQHPVKHTPLEILTLYENNVALFKQFSFLGNILEKMRTNILEPYVDWRIQDHQLPNTPILARITYKNVSKLTYRLVQLTQTEKLPPKEEDHIGYLLTKPALREVSLSLPLSGDHVKHRLFLKLDGLPAGRYFLLFSDTAIGDPITKTNACEFVVSRLTILHSKNSVLLLDSRTGSPLPHAHISAEEQNGFTTIPKTTPFSSLFTDAHGFAPAPEMDQGQLQADLQGDTNQISFYGDRDAIDETDSDDLFDYYDKNARVFLYTDRGIYRPGQTVHFKAILLTTSIQSGKTIPLTPENLKEGSAEKGLGRWWNKGKHMLYLHDAFDRDIDSLSIRLDDFGNFSDSFFIPRNAATGTWGFESDDIDPDRDCSFKVEEYKRPHFEVKILAPTKTFLPGDTLEFTIKARSFAGVSMANTRTHYTLERDGTRFLDSSETTDADGLLHLRIADPDAAKHVLADSSSIHLTYALSVTATDMAGESHDAGRDLSVSSRPVDIILPGQAVYLLSDTALQYVKVRDINGLAVDKPLSVKIYKEAARTPVSQEDLSGFADQWIYPVSSLEQWFPDVKFTDSSQSSMDELYYSCTLNIHDFEKLHFPSEKWKPGSYRIVLECREKGHLWGEKIVHWTVLDENSKEFPDHSSAFLYLRNNLYKPGDTLRFYSGSVLDSAYTLVDLQYLSDNQPPWHTSSILLHRLCRRGMTKWVWTIPKHARDRVLITLMIVQNNRIFRKEETIWINSSKEQPLIRIDRFRDNFAPGENTQFRVSVMSNNAAVAAQLMSTIYDATLDKLAVHQWQKPYLSPRDRLTSDWPYQLNSSIDQTVEGGMHTHRNIFPYEPLWWLNGDLPGQLKLDYLTNGYIGSDPVTALDGRVPGLYITSTRGYEEVTEQAFTTVRLNTGSVSIIRGANSLPPLDPHGLVILDGTVYTGDVKKINLRTITQGILLLGADATSLYGTRAAHGVLILSTKGEIQLPSKLQEPIVRVRKDFNETAYFSANITQDKNGQFALSFSLPESVTEWDWKLLAETKNARFAYAERKFNTQLPLMVQPHLPRFLYQGDHILLKTRISNLDTSSLKGQAWCSIQDALTGEDLTAAIANTAQKPFVIAGASEAITSFPLKIPRHLLHSLKITIKAAAAGYSDAEEHLIPVLSTRVLLRKSTAFQIAHPGDSVYNPSAPGAGDSLIGLGISLTQPPQNSLLNALPWLANYSYNCAEQTFNKMLAQAIALELMRADTNLQAAFHEESKNTHGSPDRQPDEPFYSQMPWLDLPRKAARQKEDLRQLLDTNKTRAAIENHLMRLYSLQNPDGGISWFDGGKSNPYISAYLMAGLGQLDKGPWRFPSEILDKIDTLTAALIHFEDANPDRQDLYYAYARKYWERKYPCSAIVLSKIRTLIADHWEKNEKAGLYTKALLAITSMAYFKPQEACYKKAAALLEDIREEAIEDPVNGTRWKELSDADDLSTGEEETLAILSEALSVDGRDSSIEMGIVQWLLMTRSDHHWSSTKATAAVIDLLRATKGSAVAPTPTVNVTAHDSLYTLSGGLLSGSPYLFLPVSAPFPIRMHTTQPGAVSGNLISYYLSDPSSLNHLNSNIKLDKKLYRYDSPSGTWELLSDGTILHLADRLKVVLILETAKPLKYVYVEDHLAGSLEPLSVQSGYSDESGFSVYRSIRDMGNQFFCEFIPSGRWQISYEVSVEQEGKFTLGPAMLQCLYRPELVAYSNASLIQVSH